MPPFQSFAIIPAAGRSRRMGRPKLMLPVGGRPLVDRVLEAWSDSRVREIVVVVRAADAELRRRCERRHVHVVAADEDPVDMRASIELGLAHVEATFSPRPTDAWLTAPADLPALSAALIDRLLTAHDPASPRLAAPAVGGRLGHPLLLPWACAERLRALPPGEGLNALTRAGRVRRVPWPADDILRDVDTPADYEALLSPTPREKCG